MSDFKTEYPVLYFNEYFKRKPMRLNERESEELFTLEETDVNNFEYISLHDHEKEIASLKELIEQAYQYVEYAVTYSTPLSQKLSERWISEVETRRKK